MIPKTIHYFWEGKTPDYNYTGTWKKLCPDYEIIHWNIDSLPINEFPKLAILIEHKKYSILSDFLRHWALYQFGGFYLDFDMELLQSLDNLRSIKSFVCIEGKPVFGNAAVCGAMPGQTFQKLAIECFMAFDFEELLNNNTGSLPPEVMVSPYMVSRIIREYKQAELDESDLYHVKTYTDGFTTLPKRYFYPYNYNEIFDSNCITSDTYGIHHWKKSWS